MLSPVETKRGPGPFGLRASIPYEVERLVPAHHQCVPDAVEEPFALFGCPIEGDVSGLSNPSSGAKNQGSPLEILQDEATDPSTARLVDIRQ